jgi:GNAT superfamily N-acetyltransferase
MPSILPNGLRLALARERTPIEYAPKVIIDKEPRTLVPVQKDRRSSWKWNKIICKYSASAKSKKLKNEQRERRSLILDERRGITRNEFNLGILLNITDEFIPELSMDDDQRIPSFSSSVESYGNFIELSLSKNTDSFIDSSCNQSISSNSSDTRVIEYYNELKQNQKYQFTTINGEPPLALKHIYNQADTLVKSTFAKYDVLMDLNHTVEDGFTSDILLSNNNIVVGVQEFVLMKGYLWLESLIVSESFRRQGIGKVFLKRLIDIGRAVKKSILLYALMESLPFYFSCGFQLCPQCNLIN